jgi:hypothetical protein
MHQFIVLHISTIVGPSSFVHPEFEDMSQSLRTNAVRHLRLPDRGKLASVQVVEMTIVLFGGRGVLHMRVAPRIMPTTLSWMDLAQAGWGRFHPMNIPLTKVISVLIIRFLLLSVPAFDPSV